MSGAADSSFHEPTGNPLIRYGVPVVALALLLWLGWFLYQSMTGVHGVAVKEQPPVISNLLPPPPPPPPPPPKPEEKPPEPTEKPTPSPAPSPTPDKAAPAPMQMNAEAQAGPGGIAAGSGTGSGAPGGTGTCLSNCGGPSGAFSDGFYTRYLSGALQQRVQRESKVNRSVFTADFAIWISGGRVTKAQLLQSSGDDRRDAILKSVIEEASGLDQPPASYKFPQRITVRGRKSL